MPTTFSMSIEVGIGHSAFTSSMSAPEHGPCYLGGSGQTHLAHPSSMTTPICLAPFPPHSGVFFPTLFFSYVNLCLCESTWQAKIYRSLLQKVSPFSERRKVPSGVEECRAETSTSSTGAVGKTWTGALARPSSKMQVFRRKQEAS